CGQEKERKHVLTNLADLVIKRVDQPGKVVFGDQLTRKAQQQLIEQIRAQPWRFVGQERLSFSTVPSLQGDRLEPRHLMLRTFLAGDGENYDVMPGGLTRVAGQAEDPLITGQSGAWSKDTWVLRKSGSMRDVLRLHRGTHGSHAAAELTSRAAENLFWAASYLQRSESLLRAATAYQNRYDTWLDYNLETDRRVLEQWLAVLSIYIPELTGTVPAPDTLRRAMLSGKAGSLVWNLRRAIEGVYTVRDFWPLDSWRVIEELEELIGYAERNVEVVALDHLVHRLL